MIVRELIVQYRPRPDLPPLDCRVLTHPRDLAAFIRPILENEPVEVFLVLCLTTKYQVLAFREIGRGTIDKVIVSPREIFQVVLLANAAVLAVAHNHPSGDPTPSPDDMALTRAIAAGATLMSIQFLDHIIWGGDRYYSFKEGGGL